MAGRLTDDLVEEILLSLAPDDPVSLVRAACPRWRRVVSTPGFRRGFAQRHRTAPMLGFFVNGVWRADRSWDDDDAAYAYAASFVPAASFRPRRADLRDLSAIDARHGCVLLLSMPYRTALALEVWDPVTDELWKLPNLPHYPISWNAAVVCAAHGACDHLDCRRGPFLVVLLDSAPKKMRVFVYSSEAGAWSGFNYGHPSSNYAVEMVPPTLVGNALHFLTGAGIFQYDLAARIVSRIPLPVRFFSVFAALTTTEDGGLGFARVEESMTEDALTCTLRHWSMVTGPEGDVLWAQSRSIALDETLLGVGVSSIKTDHVAFAHGVRVFFKGTHNAWSSIDLKSGRVREEKYGQGYIYGVVPYTSFYTPGIALFSL
ncbi:hypothetical protein HU200_028986 [Digitaria exilis]|uniref:F-box domain-containing protein n=1 Tax=Digitaria exilis TaxID=1010633 RepID=A0A835ETD7_9POAL|nr:hypothetical protein HU200_028986 [Digitaria exilis]